MENLEEKVIIQQCDYLLEILEAEKKHLISFLQGNLQEEYLVLLNVELDMVRKVKKYLL